MTDPDFQIIGHGLAGAILAEVVARSGLRVRVWDDGGPASSDVAAGLFTPLTGMRLAPSWRIDDALPAMSNFYSSLQQELGTTLFHPLPTCRIFRSEEQAQEWGGRTSPEFVRTVDVSDLPIKAPWGAVCIDGGGWVDLPSMLDALRQRRQDQNAWGPPRSDAALTVWAEGARAAENPLWKDAGWRNAHGDVLIVRVPGLATHQVYSFGKFLQPIGDDLFRCGATYTWDHTCSKPREEGRVELERELRGLLKLPFEVIDHQAGIRPVAVARVPIVGPHPDDEHQWIFNGFASKGVLYAPWLAARLVDYVRDGRALPAETWAPRRIERNRARLATAQNQASRRSD